jgi:hypothetical protein
MNEYDWTKSKNEYPFFCIECMEPVEKDVCDTCGGEANDRWLICECEDFGTLQKWLDSVSGLKKYVPELPASVAHLRHYYKHTDSDVVDLCDYVDQLRARIAELENPDMTKLLTVRTAAKNRHPLDGMDAQCMEHAITITERERDTALKRIAELEAETKHLYQQIAIQADIEKAITTSLRAQIKELCARIAELEKENKNIPLCHSEIDRLVADLKAASKRIAAIEAAGQWRPLSDLSHNGKKLEVLRKTGEIVNECRYDFTFKCYCDKDNHEIKDVTHWRDLPPMPEGEE